MQDQKNGSKQDESGGHGRDPWLPLLAKLPLSRTEKEVVRRYEGDPFGRAFLPVADILRSHRLIDESLELLTEGVVRHPGFTVARVVLARELLQKGLVAESWRVLEESTVPLRDNLLAQKLRFRLALLLGLESQVRSTFQHITMHQMLDSDTKHLGDLFELSGIGRARERLMADLRDRGIELVIPTESPVSVGPVEAPHSRSQNAKQSSGSGPDPKPFTFDPQGDSDSNDSQARLEAFHVVPLDEIFRSGDPGMGSMQALGAASSGVSGPGGGLELDSTTLADIYALQGHYGKALAVYRRLLRLSPHNELLRRKHAELVKLEKEQRDVDLSIDPSLIDRMESVEIIDRQIKFYNDLLSRLS